jgi:mono/diheme cytochrome c family protein
VLVKGCNTDGKALKMVAQRTVAMRVINLGVILLGAALGVVSSAAALPFNDDMVSVQKRTGVMMRQKAPGTVAIGMSKYHVANREAAEALTNPLKGDAKSMANGKRLFAVNCLPCHGDISKKPYEPGQVGKKSLQTPPDLTSDMYKTRTDGSIYATIHFGIRLMPGHGWKLSPTEHWDIVNYVRSQQGVN